MTDLFSSIPSPKVAAPLAEQMRPQQLGDVIGQDHLLGSEGALTYLLSLPKLSSLILWGPPGCGKTTLAQLIAKLKGQQFAQLSAVFAGVADLRKVYESAQRLSGMILFIDEIHRFNKAQQDALLGPIEAGLITLIGATTENPSFSLNAALLSRARVLIIKRLSDESLALLLEKAEKFIGRSLPLTPAAKQLLLAMSDGDGRMLLNLVETLFQENSQTPLDEADLQQRLQRRAAHYDKGGEAHYDLISAFIKSLRGSDADAAAYWFARMIQGGEDPLYLARRMIRFASEDIGLADPQALPFALAACQAYQALGSPEGELSLLNAVLYLATAPKSNAAYLTYKNVIKAAEQSGSLPPPYNIVNAPTKLMKEQGYGKGYQYDHDYPEAYSGQNFWPDSMGAQKFYVPVNRGFEREIKKRLDYWQSLRTIKSKKDDD